LNSSCRQLTVDVPEELKDAVIGELSEQRATGIWENGEPSPGVTRLEIYFDPDFNRADVESRIHSVFLRANIAPPQISVGTVADRDWLGEWKKSYVSFPIGRGFFIIPSWSETPCPEDRKPISIDPGQAFGTGTHETTQLTLEFLEEYAGNLARSAQILDLGTGSGILAIAARLLGCRRIIGCDTDPDSIQVAVENIGRNVSDPLPMFCGSIDAVDAESVDFLLCNLTVDVIANLFEEIVRALRPGGAAILSGILVEQRQQIHDIVSRNGWAVEDDRTRGEWIALAIRKPSKGHGD
jgi:ribosomal protein L11 methyltransferase